MFELLHFREPEKITLNDLAKDKIQASLKTNTNDKKTSLESLSDSEDQDILDCKKDTVLQMNTMNIAEKIILDDAQKQETEQNANITEESKKPVVVATPKPLAEITVDIDDLTPEKECQVLLDDEDIQVSLNLAADRPTPHVTVIVMSVTNKSHLPMEDIHFEASVRKVR